MKTKFYIIMVLAMLLFALTITAGGKQSDLPEQANSNGSVNKNSELLLFHFQQIADRLYQKMDGCHQG